jgi:MFS family permease
MSGAHWSLFRNRGFALLWSSGLISMIGAWTLRVAVPIYVYQMTKSPAATSAVVAVIVAVSLLVAPFAGILVDRWDRRRVLIVANAAHALTLVPLFLVNQEADLPLLLAVLAVQTALAQFVAPAEHALLPRLVAGDDLAAANALNALNNNLARLIGPAAGGLVAARTGLDGAVLVNVATFLVAMLLMLGVPGRHRAAPEIGDAHVGAGPLVRFGREFVAGLRAAGHSSMLRVVFVVLALVSVGEGLMGSLFAVFVYRALNGGPAEIGYLASGQAIGGIVGGLAGAWIARRVAVHRQIAVSMVLFGLTDIVIFNYPRWLPEVWPGVVLMAVVGVPGALIMAGFMTILQSEVSDAFRGRVFSAAMVTQSTAMLAGTALAATLTDKLGVITLLTAQGAGYAIGGVCFGLLARRARRREQAAEAPVETPMPVEARTGSA